MKFSFLQISDFHISKRHTLFSSYVEEEIKKEIQEKIYETLKKAVNITKEKKLDAILIPGDLFDSDGIDYEIFEKVYETFKLLDNIPVIITPGNHDFYNNVFSKEVIGFYGIQVPKNIYIFSSEKFTPFVTENAIIYGCAAYERDFLPFAYPPEIDSKKINIGIFHGSYMEYIPPKKEIWLAFNKDQLIKSGFDYVALGHYHKYFEIKDENGITRAAYGGSAVPITKEEIGPRGGLIVVIEKEGEKSNVHTEFIKLAPLEVKKVEEMISEEDSLEKLINKILSFDKENTLLYLKLSGNISHEVSLKIEKELEKLRQKFLYIKIDTSALLEYGNLEELILEHNPESTIGKFLKKIKEEMDLANEEEKKLLKKSLYYGLEALKGRSIKPRYEIEEV